MSRIDLTREADLAWALADKFPHWWQVHGCDRGTISMHTGFHRDPIVTFTVEQAEWLLQAHELMSASNSDKESEK